MVTVRKTPERGTPFDIERVKAVVNPEDRPGMIAYRLIDEVIEDYPRPDRQLERGGRGARRPHRGLVRAADSPADLEPPPRHPPRSPHALPTRDAIRQIVDDRTDVEEGRSLPRELQIAFGNAYDKVLRASEALDYIRDLLNSARDYYTAKVAQDQNEVVKRLTVVASLLLVPTFIVGVYGQNFTYIPEINDWGTGAMCGHGC